MAIAVEMQGITRRFGHIVANDDINLGIQAGHIHAILGENGAGKTTLMRILYGEEQTDAGVIHIRGREATIHSPSAAIRLGIGMVHQHFLLLHDYTIPENFALGVEPTRRGIFTDYEPVRSQARDILERLGIPLDLNTPVGRFSVEEQQIIEIGKALYRGADILILDEPTSVLTPQKVEKLLDILRTLRAEGKTIILITHKLEEALAVADEITVLRKGKHIATLPRSEVNRGLLIKMMVGDGTVLDVMQKNGQCGDPLLSLRNVSIRSNGRYVMRSVSFDVHRGEIFGLTGVGGNGQSELIEAIAGLRPITEGKIWLNGQHIGEMDIQERRQASMAHVPEDRLHRGLATSLSVLDNLIMGHHTLPPLRQRLRLHYSRAQTMARELIERYSIVTSSVDAPARSLSGGNLQKVIIAREFAFDSDFLIVAYPSQGIDIRTTSFVHNELINRRNQGSAILLVSGDLDEVLALSDRIGVMFRGELVVITKPEQTDRIQLGHYMTGVLQQGESHRET